jgi:hypothetical protein
MILPTEASLIRAGLKSIENPFVHSKRIFLFETTIRLSQGDPISLTESLLFWPCFRLT